MRGSSLPPASFSAVLNSDTVVMLPHSNSGQEVQEAAVKKPQALGTFQILARDFQLHTFNLARSSTAPATTTPTPTHRAGGGLLLFAPRLHLLPPVLLPRAQVAI